MINLKDCKPRFIYKIQSRNLSFGVFDGTNGFIGIREKLGSLYLFKEYYCDGRNPLGTVLVLKEIEQTPGNLLIKETLGTIDAHTRKVKAIAKGSPQEGMANWLSSVMK